MKKCPKCQQTLPITRFNTRTNGNFYSWCKACTGNTYKDREYNIYKPSEQKRRRATRPFRTMLNNCKGRKKGDSFDLTEQFLIDLYEQQGGKCYWLGVSMSTAIGSKAFDLVSIDRLDNSKGYTKDNVVLSCWYANLGRGNKTKEEYRIWVELLKKSLVQAVEVKEMTGLATT